MLDYTGFYGDRKFPVLGHGMEQPSIGIYSYELYRFYDVNRIIRIGSCRAYSEKLNLKLAETATNLEIPIKRERVDSADEFSVKMRTISKSCETKTVVWLLKWNPSHYFPMLKYAENRLRAYSRCLITWLPMQRRAPKKGNQHSLI